MFATSGVCHTVYGVLSIGTMGLHKGRVKRRTEETGDKRDVGKVWRGEEELRGDEFTGKEARNPAKDSFFTINTVNSLTILNIHFPALSRGKLQKKNGRLPRLSSFPGLSANLASRPLFPFPHNK